MGAPITPTCASFCVKSLKESPFFLRGEDFSGFFSEPFSGAITTAALITATATAITITAVIIAIAISGTFIKVKVFPFKETF